MELGNAFSELNDPAEQERRFRAQVEQAARKCRGSGHGLRSRAGAGHAAHRGRRHRHRPPHHAAHRFPFHPRSDPVSLAARPKRRECGYAEPRRMLGGNRLHGNSGQLRRQNEMKFEWLVARRYLRSPYTPGRSSAGHAVLHLRCRRGRGHARHRAGHEHRFP